jgi:hypothetical protein
VVGALCAAALCQIAAAGGAAESMTPVIAFGDAGKQSRISGTHAAAALVEMPPVEWIGHGLEVDFEASAAPELTIRIDEALADWSAMGQLAIPVRNPGEAPVSLAIRVDSGEADGAVSSRSAAAQLQPGETIVVILPLEDDDSAAMGMRKGPPADAPPLRRPVRVIGGAQGQLDLRHVTAIALALSHPASPHVLLFGEPSLVPGRPSRGGAYWRIADQFGQYTRTTWPEKIRSAAEMRDERRDEKQLLRKWRAELPRLDRFGGILQGPAFAPSGFFRTERRDGRWRLVTPDGHAFFSLGIDVVSPDVGATAVEGREYMFSELPRKGDPLAAHFGQARLARKDPRAHHVTTFDFYAANLERKFGRGYLAAWRRTAIARLRAWGFNTIGNWSDPRLTRTGAMPYVVAIALAGEYAEIDDGSNPKGPHLPDVFDPRFDAAVDAAIAEKASALAADPSLIGYFVDNELPWGSAGGDPRRRYAVALDTLRLGGTSPAKRAFVALLADKYGRAEALAQAWGVPIPSWEVLRDDGLVLPDSALAGAALDADLAAFTALHAERYFRTVASAIRRHDPNHLYLGSRFQARTPEAVAACARYCDVVSFNVYNREIGGEEWTRFHDLGKPAIIGEFQFGSTDRGLFWAGLFGAPSEEQRAPAYEHYLRSALADPDIVGCHWFEYVDEPLTGRFLDGENGHIGFVTVADMPYRGFVSAVRDANLSVLRDFR